MFFQPPSGGPPSPWSLGSYRSHDILIWVMIVFAVVMAFFLLREYFNTRKGQHLMWGSALILTFIAFHQVANTGTYEWLLLSWGSGFMVMIPALIAGGILLSTFSSKPKVAQLFLLAMATVAILVTILGLGTIEGILDFKDDPNVPLSLFEDWELIRLAITAVAALISIVVILAIPIYTTLISKETTGKAYLMVIAGVLLLIWIIGYAISMTLVKDFVDRFNADPLLSTTGPIENIGLFFVFGLFPYIFIFSTVFAALGVHYEPKWTFSIPGVEVDVEDRVLKEEISGWLSKEKVSLIAMAAGVLCLIGFLTPYIWISILGIDVLVWSWGLVSALGIVVMAEGFSAMLGGILILISAILLIATGFLARKRENLKLIGKIWIIAGFIGLMGTIMPMMMGGLDIFLSIGLYLSIGFYLPLIGSIIGIIAGAIVLRIFHELNFQKSRPLISSALGVAGGVLLLIGSVLASWINLSQSVVNLVLVGILLIGGLLGALVGFAALVSWKQELRGREISNYLKIALGAITLICAIVLLLLPTWVYYFVPFVCPPGPPCFFPPPGTWVWTGDLMDLPSIPVFLLPEGQIWIALGITLIILGPILILAGGILSEFVFKEE